MSTKEVKSALKNARDAIKNKDYKDALKHCKAVLKLEKNNYNAWVFIGVAASELEQPDQAQTAYRKALELEPEQLLAWQGLANLYEKSGETDLKEELPKVYLKLIELYRSSDKIKCLEVGKKLVNFYHSQKNYLQVARVFSTLIQLMEGVEKVQLLQQMIHLLSDSVEEQDSETQQHLMEAFEKALQLTESLPSEDHQKLSADYIRCLTKLRQEEKMKKACESMLSLYPSQTYPLEVLSTHYLQSDKSSEEGSRCFARLLEMDSDSGLAHLGMGLRALEEGRYEEAIESLSHGLTRTSSSEIGWYHLSRAQLKIHRYADSVTSSNQGLRLKAGGGDIRQKLLRMKLEALVRSGEQNADQALDTLAQLPDANGDPILLSLKGRVYLQKGQAEQALQLSLELLTSHPDQVEGLLLRGLAHQAKGEHLLAEQSFLKALAQSPSSGECYFLLGRLYWDMGEATRREKSKAHTHLLKAAKLEPHLGSVFRYLGHYYRHVAEEGSRARGCYRKAFELDPRDAEAGAASVDLSMEQGDMDSAMAVLKQVTEKATPGSAKWAWMRRGLYHLKVGQHPQAIADLQAALRADPQDSVCWECLGEAYLNRRSFTAALKAFAKAHLLNPSSIYSLYQTAAIKQILGKFSEASSEYMQIVTQEEYVPALKGLGECLVSLAKIAVEDYLDGRAIDHIQQAISYLYRAVKQRPDLCCLWKLLGDACTAVRCVSPDRARVLLPGPLTGLEPINQAHILEQVPLLRLGERCYGHALKLMPEAPGLWYDLGLNYYFQSQLPSVQEESRGLQEKSLQCVKKAIMLDAGNYSYWNALGVVAMGRGIGNFALAQHCFIKSVKTEPNNVIAWTNLGALYLKNENIELAHEAFKIAQSLEPLYVSCWIGQALIAETVESYDTMDLFRHTTELSTHTEGVKGYAYWVCSTILDPSKRDSELYRYNIVQMNAVSAAQVALSKYTERIRTDPDAFVMLGFLNEQLQLKKQATQAYKRAVELLEKSPHLEELAFARRNYGRALCATGQWEEAVRIYSSTPLEELHDITGFALANFRAGFHLEAVAAYERALAVASSEKDKAYILTALALLQHRQGNMDSAKTLLFKCSMLKQPVPESLLCLCALGLVHGDATLAAAALTELLKQGTATGDTVEHRCLLTCALLALQGNYSAVQREASRAVHSNPGNPSLWALLSRLVPLYHPRKAHGGAVAGTVACHASMTQGKRAMLYSAVNQLASGSYSGDDKSRNALKTMQRAVLLCPDDPAVWAGLMAACHTENTACALSGSAPKKHGLEPILMAIVSEKVGGADLERPLAQALESWVLLQAVTGLKQGGQLEQAEALCSQVLSVSPEHPAVVLLLRQIQCERLLLASASTALPTTILEQLSATVLANQSSVPAWHWLAEVYRTQGLLVQAVMAYRHSLQLASQLGHFSGKVGSLLRLALLALTPCMVNVQSSEWKDLVLEATTEALKLGPCPVALLLQALLQFCTKMASRETRRLLERIVYAPTHGYPESIVSVARWYLLRHLHAKDDQELMDTLLEQAKASGDRRLVEFHTQLTCSP